MGNHSSDIRLRRDTTVARHVWEVHESDLMCLKFAVIELVCPSSGLNNRMELYIEISESTLCHFMLAVFYVLFWHAY